MTQGKGQIGLTVAERLPPQSGAFNYRPASMEHWVQDLPRGNIGATAKLVYGALREVNRLQIGWRDRQRFLEQMREPVAYVQDSLHRRFSNVSFPLQPKTKQVVQLAKTLYLEMALGYKEAIEEHYASGFLMRDNKALTELIHRAVHYLSRALLITYQTYAPHPEDSWFELHLLYLHAEHKRIHQNPIKDPLSKALPESSIARQYKQILLLALASPYRMRQGEAEITYNILARWAGHAHIIPYNDPAAAEALFVVHMDSDDAPDFQAFNHRDCNTELCRLVDTRQLSQVLQEELHNISQQPLQPGRVPPQLLHRLISSWGVAPKRTFNRSDRSAQIEVVVGSNSLHLALASERGDKKLLEREKSSYQSRSVEGVSQPSKVDIWGIFSSESLSKQYDDFQRFTAPTPPPAPKSHPKVSPLRWQIRNESAGGYRLAIEEGHDAKVLVGELLGLRHTEAEQHWEIGVIRWLRQPAEGELELGIQVLAPQAMPVTLRKYRPGIKGAEFQPALLLPEVAAIGQKATLLAPVLLFEPGDELLLKCQDSEAHIRLQQRVQDGGSFNQFLFTRVETGVTKSRQTPQQQPLQTKGLNIDWDEL